MQRIIASIAVASAGTALGQVQTQSFAGVPNIAETLTFDQFDGNLADLIDICITLEIAAIGGQAIVDNDGAQAGQATVDFGVEGTLSAPVVNLFPTPSVAVASNAVFNLGADDGDGPLNVDGTGPDGAVVPGVNGSDSDTVNINAAFFSDYVGNGTFDIVAEIDTLFDIFGISGVEGSFSPPSVEGTVTVEYKVIPAPASAALLGLGGLAAARRRR
ncbi:MAG: choice-of-anchor E domain-containing protein [Planctomycetota bacterium]